MNKLTLGCTILAMAGAGCAGSRVEVEPLLQDFTRYEGDLQDVDARTDAERILESGKEKRSQARSLLDQNKRREAYLLMEEALADAQVALDAASVNAARHDAERCRLQIEQARAKWKDAMFILEQTEDFSGRKTSVSRSEPALDGQGPPLPPTTLSAGPPWGAVADIESRWKAWRKVATDYDVAAADLEAAFTRSVSRTQAKDAKEESIRHQSHLASRIVQSLECRVRRRVEERVCQEGTELTARFGDAREEALRATLELERSLQENLRRELDQVRAEARNRQNELYDALSQLEGKFASIRRDARGTIVSLADILFDFDKATLKRDVEFNLVKIATILNQFGEMKILIEGHTDSVGTEEYNLDLSRRRAKAVHDFLTSQDVDPDRMSWEGYGESRPVADNETEAGRQKNRRVDLVIQEAQQ